MRKKEPKHKDSKRYYCHKKLKENGLKVAALKRTIYIKTDQVDTLKPKAKRWLGILKECGYNQQIEI